MPICNLHGKWHPFESPTENLFVEIILPRTKTNRMVFIIHSFSLLFHLMFSVRLLLYPSFLPIFNCGILNISFYIFHINQITDHIRFDIKLLLEDKTCAVDSYLFWTQTFVKTGVCNSFYTFNDLAFRGWKRYHFWTHTFLGNNVWWKIIRKNFPTKHIERSKIMIS